VWRRSDLRKGEADLSIEEARLTVEFITRQWESVTMADSKEKTNVADLTLERVRRLEGSIDEMKRLIGVQGQKLDALIDLAAGTRADFAGFMKLYAAQDDTVSHIAKGVGLIKKRLDLVDGE
jgi:hypothetical protein